MHRFRLTLRPGRAQVRAPVRRDGSVRSEVEESAHSFAQGWLHWTRVVDLAIQRHQDLDRLNLRILSRDLFGLVYLFVRQVFDCMTEDLEGAAGLN